MRRPSEGTGAYQRGHDYRTSAYQRYENGMVGLLRLLVRI
jgi:hypothetical protein